MTKFKTSLTLFLLAVLSVPSMAETLKELSIEARHYVGRPRIAEMRPFEADKELALNMHFGLWGPSYWHNRVLTRTDGTQFRFIEWNFQIGVEVLGGVSVEYEHRSQHLLDAYGGPFPNSDSIGVKWRVR